MSTDRYPWGDFQVRRMGFGAMQFSEPAVLGPPPAIAALRRALRPHPNNLARGRCDGTGGCLPVESPVDLRADVDLDDQICADMDTVA